MTMTKPEQLRLIMTRDTEMPLRRVAGSNIDVRHLLPSDATMLGALLYESYHGTVDDGGETPEDSVVEAERTLQGLYGEILWTASYVVQWGNKLVSACVVSDYEKLRPLLTFAVTSPSHQGKGYGTCLIERSISSLKQMKIKQLNLVVTDANTNAVRLYKKLGFVQTGVGSGNG